MSNVFHVWTEVKMGGDDYIVRQEVSSFEEMECYLDDIDQDEIVGNLDDDGYCFIQVDNNMLIWYKEGFERDLIEEIESEYDYDCENDSSWKSWSSIWMNKV